MAWTSSVANGDGTFQFYPDDGSDPLTAAGPAAEAKHAELNPGGPVQPSADLMAAAAPGEDQRTAGIADWFKTDEAPHIPGMGPTGMGAGDVNPRGEPVSVSDALSNAFKGDPEKLREIQNRNRPAGTPEIPPTITLPDQDMTGGGEKGGGGTSIPAGKVRMAPAGPSGPNIGGIPVLGLPAAGGKVIPGQEQQAGRTTEQTVIPDADKKATEAAQTNVVKSQEKLTDVEAKEAEDVAATRNSTSLGIDKFESDRKANEALRAGQMRDQFARAEALSRESANEPVDSDHFWKTKSGGERGIAALAVALGAAGSALAHTPNVAAEMYSKAIDHDIEAQKSNQANKRAGAQQASTLFGQYRDIMGDERQAAAQTKMDMLEAGARHIEDVAKTSASPKTRATAELAKNALYEHWDEAREQRDAIREHRAFKYVPAHTAGGQAPAKFDFKNGEIVTYGGKQYAIKSGDEGAKVRERIANGAKASDAADNFLSLAGNSANYVTPEGRAQIRQAAAAMKTAAGKAGDFNARLSGESAKAVEDLTGAGDSPDAISHIITKGGALAAVKQYKASLDSDAHAELGAQSAIPVESRYYATPTGFERGYVPTGGEVKGTPQGMAQVGEQ